MAFGWLKNIGKGIGKGVQVVDQVASTPGLGMLLKGAPVIGTALIINHQVNQLIPHPDFAAQRREAAIIALRAEHPVYDDETLGKIYDATAFLKSVTPK